MDLDLSRPATNRTTEQFLDALTGEGLISGITTAKVTIDPPSLATGADGSATGTVNGAAVGDGVFLIPPYDMQEIIYSGAVSAANTVEVAFFNTSAGTVDLASGTWIAIVFHRA